MSVSSSEDPVTTVVDILQDAADSEWSAVGSPPDLIEPYEDTDFSRKQRRDTQDAIYVLKSDQGTNTAIGARYKPYRDEHTVRAEAWTPTDSTTAFQYFQDLRSITNGYTNDNKQQTTWTQIATVGDDDLRASARAKGVDHYIHAALIELLAPREE